MFKDEYKKLLSMLEGSKDLKNFNLEEMLKECVQFFEVLRAAYPSALKEERQDMLHMMTTLHAKLQEMSKELTKASGLTEEELYAYSENPSNFSPEHWRLVQESRKNLYESAKKFTQAVEEQKKLSSPGAAKPAVAPASRSIRSATRRTKRSGWTKT